MLFEQAREPTTGQPTTENLHPYHEQTRLGAHSTTPQPNNTEKLTDNRQPRPQLRHNRHTLCAARTQESDKNRQPSQPFWSLTSFLTPTLLWLHSLSAENGKYRLTFLEWKMEFMVALSKLSPSSYYPSFSKKNSSRKVQQNTKHSTGGTYQKLNHTFRKSLIITNWLSQNPVIFTMKKILEVELKLNRIGAFQSFGNLFHRPLVAFQNTCNN